MKTKHKKIYEYISDDALDMKKIMEEYTGYISTIINRYSSSISKEDAEEIILDVYLTLWKNKDKLYISNDILPYLAGITKNLIKMKFRKIEFLNNIDDYEDSLIDISDIELKFVKEEEYTNIIKLLDKHVSIEDKKVFLSYYYDDKSIKEISSDLEMKESKVKSKLFRIRKKLRKILKSKEGK